MHGLFPFLLSGVTRLLGRRRKQGGNLGLRRERQNGPSREAIMEAIGPQAATEEELRKLNAKVEDMAKSMERMEVTLRQIAANTRPVPNNASSYQRPSIYSS
jgi:hypothetical protein